MSSFENLSVITKHLSIVQKNLKAFAEERLFFDLAQDTATIIYFNPDSDSLGQLVIQKILMDRIQEIFAEFKNNAEAAEKIDELAKTELVDVDDQDFADWADYFLTEKADCYNGVIPFLREKIEGAEKMTDSGRAECFKKIRKAASYCQAKKIRGVWCFGGSEFSHQQNANNGNALVCELFFWIEGNQDGLFSNDIKFSGVKILTDFLDSSDFGALHDFDEDKIDGSLTFRKVKKRFIAETAAEAREKGWCFIQEVFEKLDANSAIRDEALIKALK